MQSSSKCLSSATSVTFRELSCHIWPVAPVLDRSLGLYPCFLAYVFKLWEWWICWGQIHTLGRELCSICICPFPLLQKQLTCPSSGNASPGVFPCKWLIINIDDNGISENKSLSVLEGTLVVIWAISLFYPGRDCHRTVACLGPRSQLPCTRGRAGKQGSTVLHKALSHVFSRLIFTTTYLSTGNPTAIWRVIALLLVDPGEE